MTTSLRSGVKLISLSALLAMSLAGVSAAQTTAGRLEDDEADVAASKKRELKFSVNGGMEYQFNTGTDAKGDFSVTRFNGGLNLQTDLTADLSLSLQFNYKLDMYDFGHGPPVTGSLWDDIHTGSMGAILSYDVSDKWNVFGGPFVQSSRESGADWGDSITAAGVIGAAYHVSHDLTLGGGVVFASQIEGDLRMLPIIVVNWQITHAWRLASETGSNASGRTGLELIYEWGHGWEFGLGVAREFARFRLDDSNTAAPGGVGQDQSMPIWLRASYSPNDNLRIDGLLGVTTSGDIRVKDSDGDTLIKRDYDPAPFVGVYGTLRF